MPAHRSPVRIAVNAMRARLTIIGFNLAIITFKITHLMGLRSGPVAPGFEAPLHLPAMVALYFALLLSVSAMVVLIASGALSEDGACDSPAMIGGDLLMYLGLAHTIAGFFQPLMADLSTHRLFTAEEDAQYRALLDAVALGTVAAWTLAAWVGPAVSLLRSPFGAVRTLALGAAYVALMAVLAHFWGTSADLQASLENRPASQRPLLRLFFAPVDWLARLEWRAPAADR